MGTDNVMTQITNFKPYLFLFVTRVVGRAVRVVTIHSPDRTGMRGGDLLQGSVSEVVGLHPVRPVPLCHRCQLCRGRGKCNTLQLQGCFILYCHFIIIIIKGSIKQLSYCDVQAFLRNQISPCIQCQHVEHFLDQGLPLSILH